MKLFNLIVVLVTFSSPVVAELPLGVTSISVARGDETRPLVLSLWYMAHGGEQESVGANAVFTGTMASRDVPPILEHQPVVFVSHGGLRSAQNSGAWLSAGLARAGYLVVEVNAPRTASANDAIDEIWRRPEDVSRAIDEILNDPVWSQYIDPSRISVVGFALGGTAALSLGGGEISPESFVRSCTLAPVGPDCGWFEAQNVALEMVDEVELAESRRDPRVGSIIAIAPEYSNLFLGGLTSANVPTLLVSLGEGSVSEPFERSNNISQVVLTSATTFDAFQACTSEGPKILADDGGDPRLCGTSADTRQRLHDTIVNDILEFIKLSTD